MANDVTMHVTHVILILTLIGRCCCKIPLTLAGFASIDILEGGWSSAGCIPSIEMALSDVNSNEELLKDYQLNWVMYDSRCLAGHSINAFFQHLQTPPQKIMILGGGCSIATAPVARTAPYFNLVQMSYSTGSGELSQRKMFPTFFRTSASDVALNLPHIYIMQHYGWNRVATIHRMDPLFSVTMDDLHDLLDQNNITLVTSEIFLEDPKSQLINIKQQDARIIVVNAYEKDVRRLFCEAYKMGLYGRDYAYLLPGWFNPYWYDLNDTDCTVDEVKDAIQYSFTFSDLKKDTSGHVTISGQTYEEYNERYMNSSSLKVYGYNDYHTVAYDAVWAVALTLEKANKILMEKPIMINITDKYGNVTSRAKLLEDFTYKDSHLKDLLFDLMGQTNFHGVSGIVSFEASGDRMAITEIKQIRGDEEIPVAVFCEESKELVFYRNAKVEWPGSGPPLDGMRSIRQLVYIDMMVFISMTCLAAIGLALALGFLSFNLFNMDCSYIKMSSPRLNNVIVIGSILTYLAVIVFGVDGKFIPRDYIHIICWIQTFVLTIGFTLAFGAMFAKTWRVHAIFTRSQAPLQAKKPLQDHHLFLFVGFLALTDIIILGVWLFLDPMEVIVQELSKSAVNSTHLIQYEYEQCVSERKIYWLISLYAKDGLLLIFGCFLAYETKNVHVPAMNDSKYIGMCVYNVVVMCIMGVAVSFLLQSRMTIAYAFSAASIIFCSTGALLLLFIPKYLRKHPGESGKASFKHGTQSQSSTFRHTMKAVKKTQSRDSGLDVAMDGHVSEVENGHAQKAADDFHNAAVTEWKKVVAQKEEIIDTLEYRVKHLEGDVTSLKKKLDENEAQTMDGCKNMLSKIFEKMRTFSQADIEVLCQFIANLLEEDLVAVVTVPNGNLRPIISEETQKTHL